MMRSVLRARATVAMATGIVVLLAAGGGYAIARGGGKTVKACVQKGTHVLYTGKCHKHDKRVSWNKAGRTGPRGLAGPQGPGASKLLYDATGSAAAPTTPLGKMGPWAVTASCSQPSPGTTTTNAFLTGPSGKFDALLVSGAGTGNGSLSIPPQNNTPLISGVTSNSATQVALSAHALWLPSSGKSVETLITATATGSTNTCHMSIAITPTG
jgi:hypothetical protein